MKTNNSFKSAVNTKSAVLVSLLLLTTYNFLRSETPTTRNKVHTFRTGIADRGTTFAIYDYTVPPWKEPTKLDLSPDVAGSTLTKGKEK